MRSRSREKRCETPEETVRCLRNCAAGGPCEDCMMTPSHRCDNDLMWKAADLLEKLLCNPKEEA